MSITTPKILVIGVGSHCQRSHLDYLKELGVKPVAFVDPALDCVDGYESVPVYSTLNDVDEEINAVLIASPDRFHLPQMQYAADQGWHIFCEKPLANAAEEITQLVTLFETLQKKRLTLTTCHPRRYDPPYVTVKRMLPKLVKDYGKVLHVELDFSYHKPSKTGLHGDSMLQDHANHEIDYLSFLMGESDFKARKLHDEEDRYTMAGIRDDGVSFLFQGTRRLNARIYAESVQVRFESATLFVDTHNKENSWLLNHESRTSCPVDIPETDYQKRFLDINRHWLNVLADKEENYVTFDQMLLNTLLSVNFQKDSDFTFQRPKR